MKSNSKVLIFITAIFVLLFPFGNLFHILYPITIVGKSAWVVLPTIIVLCIYSISVLNTTITVDNKFVTAAGLIAGSIVIFLIRELIYGAGPTYLDNRFIATSLLFLLFASFIGKNEFSLKVLTTAIIAQGLLVALVITINDNFFPYVRVDIDESGIGYLTLEGIRTRDMLLGSSISGNHIICAMFLMLALIRYNILRLNIIFFLFLQLFMLYAIFLTASRYPIIVGIIITILSLRHIGSLKHFIIFFIAIGFVLYVADGLGALFNVFIIRLNQGSGGRVDKILLPTSLLLESVVNFFMGASTTQVVNTVSPEGVEISDNSYMTVALAFGVPYAIFYFSYLVKRLKVCVVDLLTTLFFAYFFIGLAITNCILWESWIFISLLTYFVIWQLYKQIKQQKSRAFSPEIKNE